jgi:hypothetical protein
MTIINTKHFLDILKAAKLFVSNEEYREKIYQLNIQSTKDYTIKFIATNGHAIFHHEIDYKINDNQKLHSQAEFNICLTKPILNQIIKDLSDKEINKRSSITFHKLIDNFNISASTKGSKDNVKLSYKISDVDFVDYERCLLPIKDDQVLYQAFQPQYMADACKALQLCSINRFVPVEIVTSETDNGYPNHAIFYIRNVNNKNSFIGLIPVKR